MQTQWMLRCPADKLDTAMKALNAVHPVTVTHSVAFAASRTRPAEVSLRLTFAQQPIAGADGLRKAFNTRNFEKMIEDVRRVLAETLGEAPLFVAVTQGYTLPQIQPPKR